jgi:tRNA1Val (adenine37-N6)-methyltransferase
MPEKPFRFKQFEVFQSRSAMRVGTDGVLLGAWANVDGAKHILDVGSGTGVIALICAQRSQDALVEAIEIDEGSAEDARYNFSLAPWQGRLKLHQGDFLKIASKEKFDLIISNPPYFSQSLRAADPSRNAARHDDSLPAEQFMAKAKGLLAPELQLCSLLEQIKTCKDVVKFLKTASYSTQLPPHMVKQECETRWNSLFTKLDSLMKVFEQVCFYRLL